MPDTTTTTKSLTKMAIGAHENTWGDTSNDNLDLIDKAFGGTLSKSISGNVTLTSTEAQNTGYTFTGSLSADATITWPTFYGPAAVRNATTGGYAVICKIAGRSVTVPAGALVPIWSDGTDFRQPAPPTARTLRSFGCAADGTTDDTANLLTALQSGWPVDGEHKTYAVTGNVSPTSLKALRNATIKQLTPDVGVDSNRRTLYLGSLSGFILENVKIDRGTLGQSDRTAADTNWADDAGLYISDCDTFWLDKVEVSGGGTGSGVVMVDCDHFTARDFFIHDMEWSFASSPGDDRLMGIDLIRCTNCTLSKPRVRALSGNYTGIADSRRWTRGIACSFGDTVTIDCPQVDSTDQCIDVSGDKNTNITVIAADVASAYNYGLKIANSGRNIKVIGGNAYRCGRAGLVISSNAASSVPQQFSSHIDVFGFTARDTGYNGPGGTVAGFWITAQPTDLIHPGDVHFRGCMAIDSLTLATGAVSVGGSGYAVNDTIYLTGILCARPAVLTVSTVSGGAVTGFTISDAGEFDGKPTTLSQYSTSGVGTGFVLGSATYSGATMKWGWRNEVTAGDFLVTCDNDCRVYGDTVTAGGVDFYGINFLNCLATASGVTIPHNTTTSVTLTGSTANDPASMVSSGVIKPRKAGRWQLFAHAKFADNATGLRTITIDGGARGSFQNTQNAVSGGDATDMGLVIILNANADQADSFTLKVRQTSGSDLTLSDARLYATWLGPFNGTLS